MDRTFILKLTFKFILLFFKGGTFEFVSYDEKPVVDCTDVENEECSQEVES